MDYAIIAAGEGSRLVQEGVEQPKPLVRLQGVPLIERLIHLFIDNGASSLSVIVNEQMINVREFVESLSLPVPLHLVVKSTPSSMHSFHCLSPYLRGGRFCLTTVDTIFKPEEFSRYIAAFREEQADGLMGVTDYVDDEKPLYVNTEAGGRIYSFTDRAEACSRYVSGGIYCLDGKALDVLDAAIREGQSRMRNFQRRLITEGLHLKAWPFSKIIDVDHAADIEKAEKFLSEPAV
ncbi:MAG: NTP transferase domain-containing protein [Tannerella sp.]|jgi:NDP-sugar pyrophosphorylase family protein|nr:NTP transferase domain-containing protein [Tannerella sp.]